MSSSTKILSTYVDAIEKAEYLVHKAAQKSIEQYNTHDAISSMSTEELQAIWDLYYHLIEPLNLPFSFVRRNILAAANDILFERHIGITK